MIDLEILKQKIAEIKKIDLGNSAQAVSDWEEQIKKYELTKSLLEIKEFKELIDEYKASVETINQILADQEILNEEDIRKRQQMLATKMVVNQFINRFTLADLSGIEQEINNNYKEFYEKSTEIKE